jgi:hypothetical protein
MEVLRFIFRPASRVVLRVTASVLVVLMLCSTARTESATQVITVQPAIPGGRPIRGSCWTGSIATDRPGAWRCTAGNMIYDPCFSVLSAQAIVVCEADPFRTPGVALRLTKPLPAATKTRCKDCVWALELADGSTCTVAGTGTLAMVAGQPLRWSCPNLTCSGNGCPEIGILGDLKLGKVWIAQKATIRWSGDSFLLLDRKFVGVRKVWK